MKEKIEVQRNKYPHQYLKMIELIGFVGCTVDMELALNLINKAVLLEKIIIDTQCTCLEETFHVSSGDTIRGRLFHCNMVNITILEYEITMFVSFICTNVLNTVLVYSIERNISILAHSAYQYLSWIVPILFFLREICFIFTKRSINNG